MSTTTNGFHGASGPSGQKRDESFEEIKIPVPWGHISGKWWGCAASQPILAVHGWQDNAGTFDTLAPLLTARGHSLLCIDLPGHGFSSPLADGHYYYIFWDGIHLVRRIAKYFGWKKITLMGHSLGGAIAFLYAATFPNDVKAYVSFDISSPSVRNPTKIIAMLGDCVDKFLKYETLTEEQMPTYKYEDMLDILYEAHNKSLTRDSCEVMLRRGMKPAAQKQGAYVFTRDPRLKVAALAFFSSDQVLEFATKIKCQVLNIRGRQGIVPDFPEIYDKVLDVIQENAALVERHLVDGTHHLHLNNPLDVVEVVDRFLKLD